MDMTRNAMEYIVEQAQPKVIELDGERYSDKRLIRIPWNERAEALRVSTLTSLVEYIKSEVDNIESKMLVHVVSPTEVQLVSSLDLDRKREVLVSAVADLPEFQYGEYIGHEKFLIALQAKFLPGKDRDLLLKFAGTVRSGSVAEYGDDGVTQKATVKSGVSSVTDAVVPNPVTLAPYRTFLEVKQPESSFVFRMRDDDVRGVQCAIFEADGGAWKYEAKRNVANYIRAELEDLKDMFTVID